MPALAITDHGNLFGTIEFYTQAMKLGTKPIIGCEIYIAPGSRIERASQGIKETSFHLILLARDEVGYKNLIKLVTIGYLEGFYYKPRIDKEVLAKHSEGLIGLSGCLKAELSQPILRGRMDEARRIAGEYRDIFGKENFYLELQHHENKEQFKLNEELLRMSKDMELPLVATNDCHYINRQDAYAHEVLLCIQTGTTIDDPGRMRFSSDDYYFRSTEEMENLFKDHPEAISNTVEIAERCNLEIQLGQPHLPHYEVPQSYTLDGYLEELSRQGIKTRYPKITSKIEERLEKELEVIKKMGYAGYFLIVADFIRYARKMGIPVGPGGRGSGAASIVAYALGITNIDPLKYGLIFERFLTPERVSLADFDVDFCYERRGEVIDYVTRKYGQENVAQVITFGTMKSKAVVRDVGRVLGIAYGEVDRIAKLIPNELNITLGEALTREPELRDLAEKEEKISLLIKVAKALEGLTRHASTHAAGVVISKDALTNHVPLYKDKKGEITTQYAMESLEKIGLLKSDFLGLRTLTVIANTAEMIGKRNFKIETIPLNDSKTYKLLRDGRTVGVFQLESFGMRDLLRKLKPKVFEDIIASVALFRPGPLSSGMVEMFIKGKRGQISEHLHPKLEPILKETYGVIVYQEQVMRIASELAGFTPGHADLLRRSMTKKDPEAMDRQRKAFTDGAMKEGIDEETANSIFDLIASFAGYGFNKPHSIGYALIAYQTAYLKTNYPIEFMIALLSTEMENTDKIVLYINESQEMGIEILPPDINESFTRFTVDGRRIRFGLGAVKNVGEQAIASIIRAREKDGKFNSLQDLCERVDLRLVNKKVIESLIKCGALDPLGKKRSQLMGIVDHAFEVGQRRQRERRDGQTSFFELIDEKGAPADEFLPQVPEWPESELLAYEKETLGLYITGHPLARYEDVIKAYCSSTISLIQNSRERDEVSLGGIIASLRKSTTRRGNKMAYFTLEDLEGKIQVTIFPEPFSKFSRYIKHDSLIYVKGRIDLSEEPKVVAREVIPLSEVKERLSSALHIRLITTGLEEDALIRLKRMLISHPGDCLTYLHLQLATREEVVVLSTFRVQPKEELVKEVEELLGEGCISYR